MFSRSTGSMTRSVRYCGAISGEVPSIEQRDVWALGVSTPAPKAQPTQISKEALTLCVVSRHSMNRYAPTILKCLLSPPK